MYARLMAKKRMGRPPGTAMTGGALKRLRQRAGLTQVELAARLGTTATTVRRWEWGLSGIAGPVALSIRSVASAAPKSQRRKR